MELGLGGDLSSQQPAAQHAVSEHHQAVPLGVRKHVLLDFTLEQIVRRLDGGKRRPLPEAIHLGGREIADADCENFPLTARGLEANGRVRPVDLKDVDHIGLEAAERILELHSEARRVELRKILPLPQSSPTLVAMIAPSRRPLSSALPTNSSERPKP